MSTADLVILYSACLLIVAVAIVATFYLIEARQPPLKGRLDALIQAAAAKKKGPCS
ncbi:hypothetical protein [Methylorubrum extorquens]|uniref:Uncharacterized protein n=1 Tax=Methylorubrum extorquens TaxID=408 RepID=A0AAX3WMR3_METEX|nr:hypothetical protein [Methylorubrum extorquens]WHQ71975.1 hypothetical protein KEC54_10715 [Methylorubrum extorquens]